MSTDASRSAGPTYPTSLGTSTAETISLLGKDLADDLMGQVGFGELAFWLVTLQRPTPSQVRVFESVLVDLRSQYALSYTPPEGESGVRAIEVRAKGPGYRVRCRPSYVYKQRPG